MDKGAPVVLSIILALFASFFLISNMPVTVEDFEGDLEVNGDLNVTGSGEFGGDLDLNLNYLLYTPLEEMIHVDFTAGATNVELAAIPAGLHGQDAHYYMLMCSVGTAPGGGKFVNVTISDGTNTMTVSISGTETNDSTTVGAFDLDVSAEDFTIIYSQTAGGASDEAVIMFHWYHKENA